MLNLAYKKVLIALKVLSNAAYHNMFLLLYGKSGIKPSEMIETQYFHSKIENKYFIKDFNR